MLRLVRMINFAYAVLSLAVYPPQYKRFTPCPSDDEYLSLSAENKKIVEEWNAYKKKYQIFNKKKLKDDNKVVRNEVDCDMVFKVAYHLF